MTTPEIYYGLRPPDGYEGPAYGARAIWTGVDGLVFVHNRQQFTGVGGLTEMADFVREKLPSIIALELRAHDVRPYDFTSRIEVGVGPYLVAMRPTNGYLYVGVWLVAGSPDHAEKH